jgi:hypothetical protein
MSSVKINVKELDRKRVLHAKILDPLGGDEHGPVRTAGKARMRMGLASHGPGRPGSDAQRLLSCLYSVPAVQ